MAVAPPPFCMGTPPSVLSFCLWIKQLPLSLFSHGSRRSVRASTALAKAFESLCSLCSTSRDAVDGRHLSLSLSLAELCVVDVSVWHYSRGVCYLCLHVSISIQIHSHMDTLSGVSGTMAFVGCGACTVAQAYRSCSYGF